MRRVNQARITCIYIRITAVQEAIATKDFFYQRILQGGENAFESCVQRMPQVKKERWEGGEKKIVRVEESPERYRGSDVRGAVM